MKKLNKQVKGAIGAKISPLKKSPSFVLNIPDDNFVTPDQIISSTVVNDSKKLLGGKTVTHSITPENLLELQSQRQNKFGKSAAERHHQQAIFPNGEDGTEQVSECDTFMSIPNQEDPEYHERFKKIKQINKCQKMKT